jgi:uncharacterized membrane protein
MRSFACLGTLLIHWMSTPGCTGGLMRTPAQIAGHPIHPMLVPIPIGLWLFSFVCDLIAMRAADPSTWVAASFYAMVGGVLGALAAAIPGLIDMLSLKGRPVQKTALEHMALNLTVVALFAINAWLRARGVIGGGASLAVSAIALVLLLVSGWLGGKMVYEAGVAVNADEAAATAAGGWSADRPAARSPRVETSGLGGRAMAADESRPSRERTPDRPMGGSSE